MIICYFVFLLDHQALRALAYSDWARIALAQYILTFVNERRPLSLSDSYICYFVKYGPDLILLFSMCIFVCGNKVCLPAISMFLDLFSQVALFPVVPFVFWNIFNNSSLKLLLILNISSFQALVVEQICLWEAELPFMNWSSNKSAKISL